MCLDRSNSPFVFAPLFKRFLRGRASVVTTLSALLIFALLTPPAARAAGEAGKSDRFLAEAVVSPPNRGWSSVILQVGGAVTPAHREQIRALGGYVYRHLPLIDSAAVRVPSKNLGRLARLPFVRRLSADVAVRKNDEFTVASSGADVAYGRYGLTGQGVTVAVVDSGIRPHYDLTNPGLLGTTLLGNTRVLKSVNFLPGTTSANDACGHGTHVAGIIGGNGTSSNGLTDFRTFYGIARKVNLINVRVLDRAGRGDVSSVVAGIQWVISNKSRYNIRVINLSLGHPVGESYTTDPLCLAVEQAWKSGIVVVCAAGNQGRQQAAADPLRDNEGHGTAYGSIQSPGNSPYVITVGAMKLAGDERPSHRIATYSSRGPTRVDLVLKPDIVAPGNRVISVQADGSYLDDEHSATNQVPWDYYRLSLLGGNSNKYFRLSGTSMAAPVVAGAAALLLQADPTLTPDTVKARLMLSADRWADPQGNYAACTYGAGYLNIPAALNSNYVATRPALSPALYRNAAGYVCVDRQQILWGDSGLWGTGVTDLASVWGTQIIWGERPEEAIPDSQALRGESVWGNQIIWGESENAVDLSSTTIRGEN